MKQLLLALTVVLSLCSCGSLELPEDGADGPQNTSTIFIDNGCGC